jgi:hypothetical protein
MPTPATSSSSTDASHNKSSRWQWFKANGVLIVLIFSFSLGLIITAYFSIKDNYVPTSKTVIVANATSPNVDQNGTFTKNKDMDILIVYEKQILVPVESFLNHKTSPINIYFYVPNDTPVYIKNIQLSSNSSNSLLTVTNSEPKENVVNITGLTGQKSSIVTGAIWNLTVEVGHPLQIRNSTEQYQLYIFYRLNNDTATELHKVIVPISWNIQTLDFSRQSYFWIIFVGVIVSRIFSYSTESRTLDVHLTPRDLLWVPFSAIITLLIFASFKEQVSLTTDLITNLALAFGFGFGFDKIFETWQKAPAKREEAPSNTSSNPS